MKNCFLIIVLLFLNGCKTSDLFKNVKDDFASEKKVIVHNKSNDQEKIDIPLNGMVFVKENETIYSISNKYKVTPKDIIVDKRIATLAIILITVFRSVEASIKSISCIESLIFLAC